MDNQYCQECGKIIVGRIDKRFCDDQCRGAYNNRVKREHEKTIRQMNSTLRKNRKILKELCPVGKATIRKSELESSGYDFSSFTSLFSTKMGVYYFCYDYGFCPIYEHGNIPKVVIIQQQDYMKNSFDPWKYVKKSGNTNSQ